MSEQIPIIELADIIQSLTNKTWTGTLEVSSSGRVTWLFFQGGVIQHVKADRSQVVLGRALYELSLIDEADYMLTLMDYEQTGRRFGEVLVELGLVDQADIHKALSHQAREDVLGAIAWRNVDARFHPGTPPLEAAFGREDTEVKLGLPGMSLLMEAARREDERSLVQEHIPSEHDVLVPVGPESLPPGTLDRRVHLLIDGYRSAAEIAEEAPLSSLECLRTLSDLVAAGRLRRLEPNELIKVGVEAERDEDFAKALRVYELAEARGFQHLDLVRRIARSYQLLGRRKEALERWMKLADQCAESQRGDLALGALREAARLDPGDLPLRRRLVGLLIEADQAQEAVKELRELIPLARERKDEPLMVELKTQLLELHPTDEPALRGLAELLRKQGDKIQAMARFDELAASLVEREAHDEAVAVYYEILDIDAENLEARLHLAQVLARMGSTDDAVREYRRLADLLYEGGLISSSINWPFLIRVYESIVELEPNSTPAWEWLARAYLENGQRDLAISRWKGMVESLRPNKGSSKGSFPPPEILQPLQQVVLLAPQDLDARRELADAHLALGQREQGVAALRGLADTAVGLAQLELARGAYEEALEVAPFDVDARRGLAALAEQQGQADEAHALWRAVGGMCLRAGQPEEAARDLRRALKLKRDDEVALRECAEADELRGQSRQAAVMWVRFAELMLGRQNLGSAREASERAHRLDPEQREVNELRARVTAAR